MDVRRVSTKIYYIGTGANNIPALFVRRSNETASQELVEGIDGMSISYGVDTDNDHAANSYQAANLVTNWTQVVSVQITVWAISPENYVATASQSNAAGTSTDKRQRQQMTMTISLRNRTG
jgi:type IV pilus assembly protein PilW